MSLGVIDSLSILWSDGKTREEISIRIYFFQQQKKNKKKNNQNTRMSLTHSLTHFSLHFTSLPICHTSSELIV